jgi:hypothetical protein
MRVTMKDLYASPDVNMYPGHTYDVDRALGDQLVAGRHAVRAESDPAEETGPATRRRTATREQPSRRGAPAEPPAAEPGPDDDGDLADSLERALRDVGASDDDVDSIAAHIAGSGEVGEQLAAAIASSPEDKLDEFVALWREVETAHDDDLVAQVVADFVASQPVVERKTVDEKAPAASKARSARKR